MQPSFPHHSRREQAEEKLLSAEPEYAITKSGQIVCTSCGGNCGQCGDSIPEGQAGMSSLVSSLRNGRPRKHGFFMRRRIRKWLALWDAFIQENNLDETR